ncbi:aspartic peptidase domain-containing protein [Lactifluus subvellereus]|nr:aspartic peptidase domain-containing protein [Lactifluus subvellereus]
MLSQKSVLIFILLDLTITSPARNIDYSPIPGHSVDSRQSLEIFDSSYAERETRSVLVKYAHASRYFAGIGLNPDDVIKLADHYSPAFSAHERPSVSLPPSDADSQPPTGGQGQKVNRVGSDVDGNSTGTDTQTGGTASDTASSDVESFYFQTAGASGGADAGTARLPLRDDISGALDILYYGPASFGTPSQVLTVDVDTGSADLWVPSNCGTCHGRQFSAARSSTFRSSNQVFSVAYVRLFGRTRAPVPPGTARAFADLGTGRVAGKVVTDVVSIAGLTIANQAFGAVNNRSEEFGKQPNDGLIGMAFGTIAQCQQPTFFENLIKARKLPAPLFSVHLSRHAEEGSSVCFGCTDPNWTTGPVTWLPVISKTYWAISMDGLWANGNKAPAKLTAAIDTGTSLIYLPSGLAVAFYGLIPGSKRATQYGPGFWTVPCFSVGKVELSFGGHRFAIHPADFYLGRVSAGSTDCVAGILSMGNGLPPNLAIIGDEFLKSWYSTYDYGNGARVGFWPDVNNK